MDVIQKIKRFFCNICNWFDRNIGPDRLTTQPRKSQFSLDEIERIKELRKQCRFSPYRNIAIKGKQTSGKKSFIKTYEESNWIRRCLRIGVFFHISVKDFVGEYVGAKDFRHLQMDFDEYVWKQLHSRIHVGDIPGGTYPPIKGSHRTYIRPLFSILIAGFMAFLLYSQEQWIDIFISATNINKLVRRIDANWGNSESKLILWALLLLIIFVCCIIIVISAYNLWHSIPFSKIKATAKPPSLEVDRVSGTEYEEHNQVIIQERNEQAIVQALCQMRWQIGHIAVFENLEQFGKEAFLPMAVHLCNLNGKINNHSNTWRFWDISRFKRPVRFLYTYCDEIGMGMDDKVPFDKEIYIPSQIRPGTVFAHLKEMLEIEVSKGTDIPMDKLFPFDTSYVQQLSNYLVNRRRLNIVVDRFIKKYREFSSLTSMNPWEHDLHKLFSFVVFDCFFPKECAKFINQDIILFHAGGICEDCNPIHIGLFRYLVSDSCPEEYRIDFLCKRYIGLHPDSMENHIKRYEQAYTAKDYKTALVCIEEAICSQPENSKLRAIREKIWGEYATAI